MSQLNDVPIVSISRSVVDITAASTITAKMPHKNMFGIAYSTPTMNA